MKIIFKVCFQYLFNNFILSGTVFYLKINFVLKVDHDLVLLETIKKTWKELKKKGNHVCSIKTY